MQGKHVFQPRTETAIDLESFIADDHFLRKVDRVLEMSFVREITVACYADGIGRSSIDPEVFFRMLLVAHLYGIKSDRRLCEEVRYNLAYRWFCRLSLEDDIPDHSSLSSPLKKSLLPNVLNKNMMSPSQNAGGKVDGIGKAK